MVPDVRVQDDCERKHIIKLMINTRTISETYSYLLLERALPWIGIGRNTPAAARGPTASFREPGPATTANSRGPPVQCRNHRRETEKIKSKTTPSSISNDLIHAKGSHVGRSGCQSSLNYFYPDTRPIVSDMVEAYVHVSAESRRAHKDPVGARRFRSLRQKVGLRVVLA